MNAQSSPESGQSRDIFDKEKLLAKFDNDEEFYEELLECYMEDIPKHLEGLHQCLSASDFEQAERWAHTIKGSSANMEAEEMRKTAFDLELALKEKDPTRFESGLKKLEQSYQRFLSILSP